MSEVVRESPYPKMGEVSNLDVLLFLNMIRVRGRKAGKEQASTGDGTA